MAEFDLAFQCTLGFEGEQLENVSGDPGGETYCGISRKNFPSWPGWDHIDAARKQSNGDAQKFASALASDSALSSLVKFFYKAQFWDCSHLSDLTSQDIANEIFDTAVNIGNGGEGQMVQEALNGFDFMGRFEEITVDGKIGPETVKAINVVCGISPDYIKQFLKMLNALQAVYYLHATEKNAALKKFFYGWLRQRVDSI